MSVQSETSKISHVGNSSNAIPYPVPFFFFDDDDLVVVITNEDRVDTRLVLDSDFSVSGAGNPEGGEILTTAAVPSTSVVTIYREILPVQSTSYEEADAFPAKSHERALDRLTMLCQQLMRAVRRSYRVRESDGDVNEVVAAANTILGLDGLMQPRTFSTSELAGFLNLTQQYFDRPIKTFADAGERALAVPEFVGQLGTQRDEESIWIATGTVVGAWSHFHTLPGAGEILGSMLADGILSADSGGRAKMADGFLTLAKIANSTFSADATGRGKFASGFVDSSLLASGASLGNMPSGTVVQTVFEKITSVATISSNIPRDNTIPQATEGGQVLTATITPRSATNKILVTMVFMGSTDSGTNDWAVAGFRGGVANAFAVGNGVRYGANYGTTVVIHWLDEPASGSAVTYAMRAGCTTNLYVNGDFGGTRLYGGAGACSILLQEIKP